MGTEWYLQAHENGRDQEIQVSGIMSEIKKERFRAQDESVDVFVDDDQFSAIYFDLRSERVCSIMIGRPVKSSRLNSLVFRIMNLGQFVLFAPDGNFPISTFHEISAHLPEGMVEGLGVPEIASSIEEFERLVEEMYS